MADKLGLLSENLRAQQYRLCKEACEYEKYLEYSNIALKPYNVAELFIAYVPNKSKTILENIFSIDVRVDENCKQIGLQHELFKQKTSKKIDEEIENWKEKTGSFKFDFSNFYPVY